MSLIHNFYRHYGELVVSDVPLDGNEPCEIKCDEPEPHAESAPQPSGA